MYICDLYEVEPASFPGLISCDFYEVSLDAPHYEHQTGSTELTAAKVKYYSLTYPEPQNDLFPWVGKRRLPRSYFGLLRTYVSTW